MLFTSNLRKPTYEDLLTIVSIARLYPLSRIISKYLKRKINSGNIPNKKKGVALRMEP